MGKKERIGKERLKNRKEVIESEWVKKRESEKKDLRIEKR